MNARAAGYTLVELLVVMGVLATLGALAMPLAAISVQREKERELRRALWEIRDAIDAYHGLHAALAPSRSGPPPHPPYPPDLSTLTRPLPDPRPGMEGRTRRLLRQLPRDPFADPSLPAEQTWALRSYRSEAERPSPGDDVYDVHSRSPAVGLNGIPLARW